MVSDEWSVQRGQMEAHIAAIQHGEGALGEELQQKVRECDEWRAKCSQMQTLLTDTEASLQEKNEAIASLEVSALLWRGIFLFSRQLFLQNKFPLSLVQLPRIFNFVACARTCVHLKIVE